MLTLDSIRTSLTGFMARFVERIENTTRRYLEGKEKRSRNQCHLLKK